MSDASRYLAFLLLFHVALTGCRTTTSEGRRSATAPLTAEQRELNLQSFDQVWTTIKDQHWDPTLGGLDWNAVRTELRPRAEAATTMAAAREVMGDMIGRLKQSHFGIIPREVYRDMTPASAGEEAATQTTKPPGATGIDVRVIDGEALVTRVRDDSPAYAAGIRPGWIVARVGKRDIKPILAKVGKAHADSSLKDYYLRASVMAQLAGDVGEKVDVTFLDGEDRKVQHALTLGPPSGSEAHFGNLPTMFVTFDARKLDPNVGYISLSAFFDPPMVMQKFTDAMTQFNKCDGVILDLRGNPGGIGFIAMGMGGFFVTESGKKLGTMITRQGPLNFVLNPRAQGYEGPLAILVDSGSASTSEILAGGLQDLKRARVFGTRTPGAALPSVVTKLPNGDGFQYAIANYISAGGQPLEGRGVVPDEEVKLDRKSLLNGRDPVIDAAVRWIESKQK